MNILIDADVLVALAKTDDSNHQKALRIAEKIALDNIFASQFTIPEAVTVISHKISQISAIGFLENVRTKKITIIPLNEELTEESDKIFSRQKGKGTSWPDCLNIAICKKYLIDSVFSFDKIYPRNDLTLAIQG